MSKLILDIYNIKINKNENQIVKGTTVTTITKCQNNHTFNNNNKYTVEDMCRLIGLSDTVPHLMAGSNVVRLQPTALCVLPQQDG